ncbi:MAG: crotonase/enoyl-CoA hydratase family protein [Halioglobus sp.]
MNYTLDNNIATLTLDDGKANVVGHELLDTVNAALFSGGFDLAEFKKGPEEGMAMVGRGFELLIRLYGFPLPLVAACTGHGIAMGAFIVMTCDSRIGTRGDFKIRLPETAIGMELPPILVELTASRISRRHMTRVALLSEVYNPDQAVDAGFIDEVVNADDLDARAQAVAEQLAQLPQAQFAANKLSVRAGTLRAMKESLEQLAKR